MPEALALALCFHGSVPQCSHGSVPQCSHGSVPQCSHGSVPLPASALQVMQEFDDAIPARRFDNFQFVNFTSESSVGAMPSTSMHQMHPYQNKHQ